MTRTHQIIWAAGFFDGEGCVSIITCNSYWSPRLAVAQNDVRPLLVLKKLFGGKIYRPTRSNRAYQWCVTGDASVRAAEAIAPYCIYKKDQLELYIDVWTSNPATNNGKPDEARDLAFAIASVQLSDMKKEVATLPESYFTGIPDGE